MTNLKVWYEDLNVMCKVVSCLFREDVISCVKTFQDGVLKYHLFKKDVFRCSYVNDDINNREIYEGDYLECIEYPASFSDGCDWASFRHRDVCYPLHECLKVQCNVKTINW